MIFVNIMELVEGKRKDVLTLEYEAYLPLAMKTLEKIAEEIESLFPVHRIVLFHRIGNVGISETSLAVLISGTHRKEPLEAVAKAVNQIKAQVPIWKKEFYKDGSVWKGNVECRWNCHNCSSNS
jgi:molybdopterin synthase catalytic subunit